MVSCYRPYTTEPEQDDGCETSFTGTDQPRRQKFYQIGKGQTKIEVNDEEDPLDKYSIHLLDNEGHEIGKYKDTVHLMGGDIVMLRNQVRELEGINSHLRQDLSSYSHASRLMVDDAELHGLTKPEVFARYAAIKKTMEIQKADLKSYKTKLQAAQNELIRKNEKEKAFLEIKRSFLSRQRLIKILEERLMKMRKLEDACQKQENVIKQMEIVLDRHRRASSRSNKDKEAEEAHEVLLKENERLREQITELKLQLQNSGYSDDDLEKMELYQKIERAKERIVALEKKLQENTRFWARERADLTRKLNEAEHSYGRSTGMVIHDYINLSSWIQLTVTNVDAVFLTYNGCLSGVTCCITQRKY